MSLFSPRFPGAALAILRIATGIFLAFFHGWGKINAAYAFFTQGAPWRFTQVVADIGFPLPVLFATAASLAEFFGGILLALGLYTRQAALAVSITMGVAVFRHATTDLRIELAALYLILGLVFFVGPATPFAVDSTLPSRRARS